MNIKALIIKWLIKFGIVKPSFYINGAETLPPPLGTAEETRLLREGGQENRNKLIVHNLRLVVYIARKFDSAAVNIEDLISIGTIGLIKAVNTFRPDKNIKLATYASRCIENEILMYLRKNASQKNEVSIDEPLNIDWDGNELLLSDVLGSDGDEVGRGIEQEDEKFLLLSFVCELPPREKQIMEMRFGMNGYEEYTQKEVADALGISVVELLHGEQAQVDTGSDIQVRQAVQVIACWAARSAVLPNCPASGALRSFPPARALRRRWFRPRFPCCPPGGTAVLWLWPCAAGTPGPEACGKCCTTAPMPIWPHGPPAPPQSPCRT